MSNFFKILRPGINSTFQDLGRFGLQHLGIVPSGCMDKSLFYLSNKLVGNKVSEGALEFAYQGPLLELVGESAFVAVSGKVNFNIINKNGEIKKGVSNESFILFSGDKIDIISTINSVYGYFSIFGGFRLDKTKESVSTLVRAKIGSNNGQKLKLDEKIFFNKSIRKEKKISLNFILMTTTLLGLCMDCNLIIFQRKAKKIFFQEIIKLQG